jgi:hypothetical protein
MTREEIICGLEELSHGFQIPEITDKQKWYEIDGDQGTEFVPYDLIGELADTSVFATLNSHDVPDELRDYVRSSRSFATSIIEGFGARLSAPGYLDCTDWSVFPTQEEAGEDLVQTYCE